ncbi:MAG: casein kinase II subunit alpha [Amphiamblys sp. WSBS2006]|nr:MAG: casein kinase II subunit alpha [Amphiamblys sp. WSBS2006]
MKHGGAKEAGSVVSVSRVYEDANKERPEEHWDYDNMVLDYREKERYAVVEKIGRGKYSDVFLGVDRVGKRRCVIKVLKPVRMRKMQREVKVLSVLSGGQGVVRLFDVVKEKEEEMPSLIFEHVNNRDFRELYPLLGASEICLYCYRLLQTLDYAHSMGIMHRDVKPHNIMIDRAEQKVRLIDWGLADYYHPRTEYNVRVASRYYKGPELLVDYRYYDYSLDMWSFGCTFAGMVLRVDTLFRGRDNADQLKKIVAVLGTEKLGKYLRKYRIAMTREIEELAGYSSRGRAFGSFINDSNRETATAEALDLMSRVLCYDHQERLTAREAMEHSYFAGIHRGASSS